MSSFIFLLFKLLFSFSVFVSCVLVFLIFLSLFLFHIMTTLTFYSHYHTKKRNITTPPYFIFSLKTRLIFPTLNFVPPRNLTQISHSRERERKTPCKQRSSLPTSLLSVCQCNKRHNARQDSAAPHTSTPVSTRLGVPKKG